VALPGLPQMLVFLEPELEQLLRVQQLVQQGLLERQAPQQALQVPEQSLWVALPGLPQTLVFLEPEREQLPRAQQLVQ